MRMTEDKLWDGLSLGRSADGFRIQTVDRLPSRKLSGDEEVLSKLAFSEYSQSVTIEKYSVIFAGRPVDFLNKKNGDHH